MLHMVRTRCSTNVLPPTVSISISVVIVVAYVVYVIVGCFLPPFLAPPVFLSVVSMIQRLMMLTFARWCW